MVPQSRSTRPLAWALRAATQAMAAASRAWPSCVVEPRPANCSASVGTRAGPFGEDAVAVRVEAQGQAVGMGRLDEHLEVARSVLLLAEGGPGDESGGIVDAAHEREPGTAILEPVVPAAIDLEEHACLGHPLATEPVTPRPSSSHRRQPGLGEDPAQRPLGHDDPLPLGEQVREVGSVDALVCRRCQLHEPGPQLVVESVGRDPAAVAVDERGSTLVGVVARQQPPHRAHREVQIRSRLADRHRTGQDVVEDPKPLLCLSVQRDGLPRLHVTEGDKVAGRLWVTDSLAVHTGDAVG